MIRRGFFPEAGPPVQAFAAGVVPDVVARLRARPQAPGTPVIVAGAGMAGLTAASELEQLGYDVTVLEADATHIGGRARTLRFDDGTYGEAGAMRIPKGHLLTRFYVDEHKLTLRPFVQVNENALARVRGSRVRMSKAADLLTNFQLNGMERGIKDFGIWATTVIRALDTLSSAELADLYADRPSTAKVRGYDGTSLWAALRQSGISSEGVQALATLWNLETSLHIALTEHLREEHEGTWSASFDEIEGGTDRLPGAMEAALRRRVRRGCVVREVKQAGAEVVVGFDGPGGPENMKGAWLVCTIPLGPLQRVTFDPPLSPAKRDTIRRVHYDSSTKVLARARRRFWETDDGIYGGGSVSDGVLGSTWYPSDNEKARDPKVSAAPATFLASYSWGQTALRMTTADTQARVIPELGLLHDSLAADPSLITELRVWSWDQHPWSAGAYAFNMPGDQTELHAELVAPEGRILLAGEHASMTHSWLQGAIESGLRAANHVTGGTP